MPERKRDWKLDTRRARSKLAANVNPYWRRIGDGLSIGYRKGERGGSWHARKYLAGRYEWWRLGSADDLPLTADGDEVLDYDGAVKKARQGPGAVTSEIRTVLDVVNYYRTEKANELKDSTKRTMDNSIKSYIEPRIGQLKLGDLSLEAIAQWHASVRDKPARGAAPRAGDTEALRRRSETANRILTILKAALNFAEKRQKYRGPAVWRLVEPFQKLDAPRPVFLQEDQARRLLNACPREFRDLARAALETGCRYGELCNMKVRDFNAEQGSVLIRESKSGKSRYVYLTDDGADFFTHLTLGRTGSKSMFLHTVIPRKKTDTPTEEKPKKQKLPEKVPRGQSWGQSDQIRPMLEACQRAAIDPPVPFKALRATYGSFLANKGVSLQVIADALGHADTRITEKHYAHLRPDYIGKQVRQHIPSFGKVTRKRVAILKPQAARRRVPILKHKA